MILSAKKEEVGHMTQGIREGKNGRNRLNKRAGGLAKEMVGPKSIDNKSIANSNSKIAPQIYSLNTIPSLIIS